jgi:hypothetical protein
MRTPKTVLLPGEGSLALPRARAIYPDQTKKNLYPKIPALNKLDEIDLATIRQNIWNQQFASKILPNKDLAKQPELPSQPAQAMIGQCACGRQG